MIVAVNGLNDFQGKGYCCSHLVSSLLTYLYRSTRSLLLVLRLGGSRVVFQIGRVEARGPGRSHWGILCDNILATACKVSRIRIIRNINSKLYFNSLLEVLSDRNNHYTNHTRCSALLGPFGNPIPYARPAYCFQQATSHHIQHIPSLAFPERTAIPCH